MRLLRAFIDASGYEVEEVKIPRSNKVSYYSVTKKELTTHDWIDKKHFLIEAM